MSDKKIEDAKPFFSVIVPNYRTETFLEECLSSLLKQEFNNFEVILVNDCSPGVEVPTKNRDYFSDSISSYWFRPYYKNRYIPPSSIPATEQAIYIFEKMVGQDPRFKFIDQKHNTGQGIARNNALKIARGKRVVFLDCDDFLPENYLATAYQEISAISGPTIVFGNIKTYIEGKFYGFKKQMKHIPKKNNLKTLLLFPTWTFNPTNYFWEIDFLKKYNLYYPGKIDDDLEFIYKAVIKFAEIYGKHHLYNFQQLNVFLNYRIFNFQTSKDKNYQPQYFYEVNLFLKKFTPELRKISIKLFILGKLLQYRCFFYRKKLTTESKVLKFVSMVISKILTLVSISVSQF